MLLQQLGKLKQLDAVAAFDEDVIVLWRLLPQGFLHGLYVLELAERRVCAPKFLAHEPHLVQVKRGDEVHNLLMFSQAHVSQLSHVAQDGHLFRHVHALEVGQRSLHARWVGVVGVYDELVVGRYLKLTAVVARHIPGQGMVVLFVGNAEVRPNGDGSEHVVEVVCADELCLHLVPSCVLAGRGDSRSLAPSKLQVGRAAHYLASDTDVWAVGLCVSHGFDVGAVVTEHLFKVLVVLVDEHESLRFVLLHVVVQFGLGAHHALKRAEAL